MIKLIKSCGNSGNSYDDAYLKHQRVPLESKVLLSHFQINNQLQTML